MDGRRCHFDRQMTQIFVNSQLCLAVIAVPSAGRSIPAPLFVCLSKAGSGHAQISHVD
jgi:hypothetical protein